MLEDTTEMADRPAHRRGRLWQDLGRPPGRQLPAPQPPPHRLHLTSHRQRDRHFPMPRLGAWPAHSAHPRHHLHFTNRVSNRRPTAKEQWLYRHYILETVFP